jgi:hypothetical protein
VNRQTDRKTDKGSALKIKFMSSKILSNKEIVSKPLSGQTCNKITIVQAREAFLMRKGSVRLNSLYYLVYNSSFVY